LAGASVRRIVLEVRVNWRVESVWGAPASVVCNPRRIEIETHGAGNPASSDEVLAGMIYVFSPGFHAPADGKRNC
jgi:stage V sporulation protein SpoVS